MYLIIDAGNTNIKFVLIKNFKIVKSLVCKKEEISKLSLDIFKKTKIDQIYLGSVIPSHNKKIILTVVKQLKITPEIISPKDFSQFFDLRNFNLKTQGTDILAFALYIALKFTSGIGISFGTATFVVFVKEKKLIGTAICSGIETSISSLQSKTELVNTKLFDKTVDKHTAKMHGTDTTSALLAGSKHMATGIIFSAKLYAKEKIHITPNVYVSGGKAAFIPNNKHDLKFIDNIVALGYYMLKKQIA